MEVIAKFLTSDASLKYLGLPGFVILLSFLFYQSLVKYKIFPRISKNQAFMILLCIILFFGYAMKLTIDSQEKSQRVYSADEMSILVGRMNITTPAETYISYFGQPTAQNPVSKFFRTENGNSSETITGITSTQYQWKKSIYVSRFTRGEKPYGLAIASRNLSVSVPHIKLISETDMYNDGITHLDSLHLRDVWGACRESQFDQRLQWLVVGPCYLGAPGDYKQFAFAIDFFERDRGNCNDEPDKWWTRNQSKSLDAMETDPCMRFLDFKIAAMSVTDQDDLKTNQEDRDELSAYELLIDFLGNYAFSHGFTF